MKEKPILFSGPMVRAILDGRKTMTRRVVKPQPTHYCDSDKCWQWKGYSWNEVIHKPDCRIDWRGEEKPIPFYEGLRLWVRETWKPVFEPDTGFVGVEFAAGGMPEDDRNAGALIDGRDRWRPSIHMPRWASRITLEITGVRVERLQDISEEDANAEGIIDGGCLNCGEPEPCNCNRPGSWDANPWVFVIEFRRVTP